MQLDSKTKWSLKLLAENLSEPTVSEPFSFFGPPPPTEFIYFQSLIRLVFTSLGFSLVFLLSFCKRTETVSCERKKGAHLSKCKLALNFL